MIDFVFVFVIAADFLYHFLVRFFIFFAKECVTVQQKAQEYDRCSIPGYDERGQYTTNFIIHSKNKEIFSRSIIKSINSRLEHLIVL